ncbi:YdeI/OmpD-associated family protein [Mesorhizobium kowhaii]
MLKRPIAEMPDFVRAELEAVGLMPAFEQRPPYQRNDYLHWIARGSLPETGRKRLNQMIDELEQGGIYMGMQHRPSKK